MSLRPILESLTTTTVDELRRREPGSYVDLKDHTGGRATEADIAARDTMRNEARRLRPNARFVSEDSNNPSRIPYPDPSLPAEVFLADPCDGSRQFGHLDFGYASCVSFHTYNPDYWWQLDAASITVSSGKTTSWDRHDGLLIGTGGNTDDSVDLRERTTRSTVAIPPCIAVGASSPSGIPLLPMLMHVVDPEVAPGTPGEDPYLRVWNTAGNPITPGLLRSHSMVAVQLSWSTQWDTMFALFGSASGLEVYPLVWPPDASAKDGEVDGKPKAMSPRDRRLWWGRPRWVPFERKCIPPIVVGPDEPYTHEVFRIVQSSSYFERERRAESPTEQEQFEAAWHNDIEDLSKARERELQDLLGE